MDIHDLIRVVKDNLVQVVALGAVAVVFGSPAVLLALRVLAPYLALAALLAVVRWWADGRLLQTQ